MKQIVFLLLILYTTKAYAQKTSTPEIYLGEMELSGCIPYGYLMKNPVLSCKAGEIISFAVSGEKENSIIEMRLEGNSLSRFLPHLTEKSKGKKVYVDKIMIKTPDGNTIQSSAVITICK